MAAVLAGGWCLDVCMAAMACAQALTDDDDGSPTMAETNNQRLGCVRVCVYVCVRVCVPDTGRTLSASAIFDDWRRPNAQHDNHKCEFTRPLHHCYPYHVPINTMYVATNYAPLMPIECGGGLARV